VIRDCRGRFAAHRGTRPLLQKTRCACEPDSRRDIAAPKRELALCLRSELRPCLVCQGPVVVDEVLPAVIPVVLVETHLEWRHANLGESLMPSPGLGDEGVGESCIELVSGDIQIVPFEPQSDMPLLRIFLQLAHYHVDGNALVFLR